MAYETTKNSFFYRTWDSRGKLNVWKLFPRLWFLLRKERKKEEWEWKKFILHARLEFRFANEWRIRLFCWPISPFATRRFVFVVGYDNWTDLLFLKIALLLILFLNTESNFQSSCQFRYRIMLISTPDYIYIYIHPSIADQIFFLPRSILVYRVCMREEEGREKKKKKEEKKYWAVAVFHPFALSNIFVCPLSVTLSNLPAFLSYGEPEGFPSPHPFFSSTFLSCFVTYLNESWMGGKLIWILNYLISRPPPPLPRKRNFH